MTHRLRLGIERQRDITHKLGETVLTSVFVRLGDDPSWGVRDTEVQYLTLVSRILNSLQMHDSPLPCLTRWLRPCITSETGVVPGNDQLGPVRRFVDKSLTVPPVNV